jgi:hypothetical protein
MIWVVLKLFFSTLHLADRLTENSVLMYIIISLGFLLFLLLRLVYFDICVHNVSISIDIYGRIKTDEISIILLMDHLLIFLG